MKSLENKKPIEDKKLECDSDSESEAESESDFDFESELESDFESDALDEYSDPGIEEVQIDLERRSLVDIDTPGIQQLLRQLFLNDPINTTQMAEEIVGQKYIGSVVAQIVVDDDDLWDANVVFGINTVLKMKSTDHLEYIHQLRAYVLEKASSHAEDSVAARFAYILGNSDLYVGLLLNERFIDFPAEVFVPLFEKLYGDLGRANANEMDYHFTHYLMIIKFYRKEATRGEPAEDIYIKPEEEVISTEAIASIEFSMDDGTDWEMSGDCLEDGRSLIAYKKIVLFEAIKLPQIILVIREWINE